MKFAEAVWHKSIVSAKLHSFKTISSTGSTLRLERGSQASGRVEVLYEGQWGTVCDEQWGIADAIVVCNYLGFPGASWYTLGGNYGEGSGPVWMSSVQCTGGEDRLQDCVQLQPWGENDCDHSRDAGVVCVPGKAFNE